MENATKYFQHQQSTGGSKIIFKKEDISSGILVYRSSMLKYIGNNLK
jgi:hypothetical protein